MITLDNGRAAVTLKNVCGCPADLNSIPLGADFFSHSIYHWQVLHRGAMLTDFLKKS